MQSSQRRRISRKARGTRTDASRRSFAHACHYPLIAIGSSDTAAGVSRPTIAHSSDGRAWTTGLLPPPARLPVGTSVYGTSLVPWARGVLAFGERADDFSAVGWSTPDGSSWTPFDPKALFGVSAIDRVVTAGGRFVLLGRLTTAAGDEPVIWLLAP